MTALMLGAPGEDARRFARNVLGETSGRDEKWLQALLFEHPELFPMDEIDPGSGYFVPICRELAIPKDGPSVYLDLLGMTPFGRLVLVECKLWRNPQARREVIAQIIEYAALMRRWSYSDLTARLKGVLQRSGANPLYDHVRESVPKLTEGQFVDQVSRSLKTADFDLVVAGDGIREDVRAMVEHLEARSGLTARLALVEFQLWSDGDGRSIVVPSTSFRAAPVPYRVVVDQQGVPLRAGTSNEVPDEVPDEASSETDRTVNPDRAANRAFWQRFIDQVRFDHPDQTPPTHGGNNWVKIAMPRPARWLTACRSVKERGFFMGLDGEEGQALYERLHAALPAMREETGLAMDLVPLSDAPFKASLRAYLPMSEPGYSTDDKFLEWLKDAANRLVNALRPRLAAWARESDLASG